MKHSAFHLMILGLVLGHAAWAQPSPAKSGKDIETVIVPGSRTTDEATHDFIQKYAAPTPFLGKLARWNRRNPICPSAGGFPPGYDRFTVNRIKDVAAMVGAPVSKIPTCKTNLAVIVTKDAQALMNEIRRHRADLLGYYTADSQADGLATMRFPVQVLYETATIDINGHVVRDGRGGTGADSQGSGDVSAGEASQDSSDNTPGGANVTAANYPSFAVSGSRVRDGLESAFFNVTIVVDAAKVDQFRLQMGALADYLAMVALSQTANFTPCEQVPSISSLMTQDCGTSGLVNAITTTDLAYLKGVYSSDAGGALITQRSTVAGEVRKSIEGR